jgi:hypothetical protein
MTFDERTSDPQEHVHPIGQGCGRSDRLQFGIVAAMMTEEASDHAAMGAGEPDGHWRLAQLPAR